MIFAYEPLIDDSTILIVFLVTISVSFVVAAWLWSYFSFLDENPPPRSILPFDVCHALLEGLEKTSTQEIKMISKDWVWVFRVKNCDRYIEVKFNCKGMTELRIWLPARYEKGRVLHEEPLVSFNDKSKLDGFVRYYVSIVKAAHSYSRESLGERDRSVPMGFYGNDPRANFNDDGSVSLA